MPTIALVIPYFGVWPVWIDLYLYSCEQNSEIDWYFFTDCEPKPSKKNVFFNYLSFETYCNQVSEKLEIDFKPTSAYKLCDLKVFYGFIHQVLLSKYDFWGFGDVDVVWGNIKTFYTNQLLEKYDVFSTHADRLSGHLAILRNNKKYTELCFKITDWQLKLTSETNYGLDEIDFSRLIYPESKYIYKTYSKVIRKIFNWRNAWVFYYNILPLLNHILLLQSRGLYFKEQHSTPMLSDDGLTFQHDADTWYYNEGKLTNNKTSREYIYLHFMIFKKNSFRKTYYWHEDYYHLSSNYNLSDGVIINKMGFSPDL